jgi:hypothetical protein
VVETIARIRREHLGWGKGIKAVARELRVSGTWCAIRSGATAFTYERREQPHPKPGFSRAPGMVVGIRRQGRAWRVADRGSASRQPGAG